MKIDIKKSFLTFLSFSLLLAIMATGCSTGIEGTKRIELSREDKKAVAPTKEDTFLSDISGDPLSGWAPGKTFYAVSDRAALIFEGGELAGDFTSLGMEGKALLFQGIGKSLLPDGSESVILYFSDNDGKQYKYNTRMSATQAGNLLSTQLPMLVDADVLDALRKRMEGKVFYTRSPLWYNEEGERIDGKKYMPVRIVEIRAGKNQFPVTLEFVDSEGTKGCMWMDLGNSGIDSRSFSQLFYLDDIKDKYPRIEESVWKEIQNCRVRPGMTKEECKLALGNPSMVDSGHDYNKIIEIYQYPDGRVLRFEDGILVSVR